jgi:4-aminobutyrate aminotransferase
VACAAAIATLELVEGQYMANARTQGERLMTGLRHLQHSYPQLGDVRGAGLMVGVELVSDATTKTKAPKLANDIVNACFERGLLLLTCGENSIRFSPPLVITAEQTDCALTIFEDALKASLP